MKTFILCMISIILRSAFAGETPTISGKWTTIDDETGKAKSVIEIIQEGERYNGKIASLIDPKVPDPKCEKCKGNKKDQPITGLEILTGFKETKPGAEWSGGEILDPENGKTYKCKMKLKDNGEKLEVRGFVGISLFGRTQVWVRKQNQ